ncbi:autotransporter outer membrane beta-barrel domain-containing protein [Lysobacter cavernae]|uniref:Autotransporter outer membrane beta-barrel domain-containing protein n=1 Tax=Lysobacter cavernae TaxID=1685901 RepID=A0ABV7RTA2_9GAMM
MKKEFALAALLAMAPLAASAADGLSYTYVEGGYAKLHIDEGELNNPEGDGAYIRGSFGFGGSYHVFGGYNQVSTDQRYDVFGGPLRIDIDLDQSELGLGYHQAMGERVDFLAELSYLRQGTDVTASLPGGPESKGSNSFSGGKIAVGVRGAASDNVEGWLKVGYLDGGDFDGTFTATLGGQVKFNPTWGIVGEVEFIEDETNYRVGVRASF